MVGKGGAAGFGLAKALELAQRRLAAQRIDQQEHLFGILAVAQQLLHGAEGDNRVEAGVGGLLHGGCR